MQENQSETSLEQEAADENTPGDRLWELAKISTQLARLVAINSSAPPELLQELAKSSDASTRENVAANPNTPTEVLLWLGSEFPAQLLNNPVFSLLLLENPNFPAVIPLPTLRSLANQKDIPEIFAIEYIACQSDEKLLIKLTRNPKIPQNILATLAKHKSYDVRWSVAFNPNTPSNSLIKLVEEKRGEMRWAVAQNPNTPLYVLEQLVQDKSIAVRVAVARNPRTPERTLEQFSEDSETNIRKAVAENPSTPKFTLVRLVQDEVTSVRQAATKNLNKHKSVLEHQ